jgi:hypothetical protein
VVCRCSRTLVRLGRSSVAVVIVRFCQRATTILSEMKALGDRRFLGLARADALYAGALALPWIFIAVPLCLWSGGRLLALATLIVAPLGMWLHVRDGYGFSGFRRRIISPRLWLWFSLFSAVTVASFLYFFAAVFPPLVTTGFVLLETTIFFQCIFAGIRNRALNPASYNNGKF